jgi:hypothetical protein
MLVRCIDNRPYLVEDEGCLREESTPGELISLTLGKTYEVLSI